MTGTFPVCRDCRPSSRQSSIHLPESYRGRSGAVEETRLPLRPTVTGAEAQWFQRPSKSRFLLPGDLGLFHPPFPLPLVCLSAHFEVQSTHQFKAIPSFLRLDRITTRRMITTHMAPQVRISK